jgi:hypothetical protein
MSDTPETDDQPIINAINDNGYQVPCVDIDFARKLEQERDEAREALDCLLAVIGLTPIIGNREALQEVVDQGLVVLRKLKDTK